MTPTVNARVVAIVIAYDGSTPTGLDEAVEVLLLRIFGIIVERIPCAPIRSTTVPVIRLMTAIAPAMK